MVLSDMLMMLKVDLGITTTAYDERLGQYILTAQSQIEREGITLSLDDLDHVSIIVMYAGWMWRRRDTGEGMPRMLRYALNNLLFSQKMEVQ